MHTEESLMALAKECTHKLANEANWHALRFAIRKVLAERDAANIRRKQLLERAERAEAELRGAEDEIKYQVKRAERAEAECERLRKLLAEMRGDWARSADPSGEAWVIEIDAALKEKP